MWSACDSSPISQMLSLGVSWWGSLFLSSLIGEISVIFGLSCSFFFLLDRGSDQGTCVEFLSTIGVSFGCLLRIFVNFLPSRSLLLSLKIMLVNNQFLLLPSNIKSLGIMTSRKYSRVDIYLDDTMVFSKLH